jgi:putative nucleotidyltransferase with HDIG domain
MKIRVPIAEVPGTQDTCGLGSHGEIVGWLADFIKKRRAKGYAVGGYVRDRILGRPSCDLDIAVSGVTPGDVASYLHRRLGFSRPVVFSRSRTALVVRANMEIEISGLLASIEKDAGRRDFTVNCLYADLGKLHRSSSSLGILDPTGLGLEDLKAGLLRTPADAFYTIWLDPIRILRAVRFHATLGFVLDSDLLDAARRVVYLLGRVAPERIRTELERTLVSRRLRSSLRLMQRTGILDIMMPELGRTHGLSQSTPYHAYDLFTHSVKTAANMPTDVKLRLAGLLHDLGKVETRKETGGRAVYYGHEKVSAEIAGSILKRLRFSKRLTDEVIYLVRNHMINYSKGWSDRGVRRFLRKMGGHLEEMLVLVEGDRKAQRPGHGMADNIAGLRRRIRSLRENDKVHFGLPVDGNDIMQILEISAGPGVGRAKDFLIEEATRRQKALTRADCVKLLRVWAEKRAPA